MEIIVTLLIIALSISLLGNWILFLNWDLWKYKYTTSVKTYEEILQDWKDLAMKRYS